MILPKRRLSRRAGALPSSGVNNFPVGQLYAGDRVREIDTPDDLAEEAADWVHILSPPGFWAWVCTANLTPLDAGEDGEALFRGTREDD